MSATNRQIRLLLLLALALAAVTVAGCGSSSSSSSSSEASTESASSPPTKPFKGPAEITKFGKPAAPSDVQAASVILAENLEARESGDFAKQCASLNGATQTEITGATKPSQRAGECPKKLEELATPLKETAKVRKNTFAGTIAELRVKGQKAWALYHGNDGKNYSIPLQQEAGSWKIGSIVTTEIN